MPLPAGQIERYRQVADYCAKVVADGGLMPSYSQIARALGICDRGTVRRHVVKAEKNGLLSRSGQVYGGMHSKFRRIRLGDGALTSVSRASDGDACNSMSC